MRTIYDLNECWFFSRSDCGAGVTLRFGTAVMLPHSWNVKDGTDGDNEYHRGKCWYVKKFTVPELPSDGEMWVEFQGASQTAAVYLNGTLLLRHEGGYSTFRVNLTPQLSEGENLLAVSVDNSPSESVYPQKADFTFYGGLYREARLITVPAAHFALGDHGGPGLKVTPVVEGKNARVTVEAGIEGPGKTVAFTVAGEARTVPVENGAARAEFLIENAHLWHGLCDPFLYDCRAELDSGDSVETSFGVRSFAVDPERGFILNGKPYPLCGAARHQDRQGLGPALSRAEHEEDMALLLEMGANTVRLAHYQHDQYFYDLCDRKGLIVWAEIPYITKHMDGGRENTLSQMTELITQCYNHPSIVVWGLSNEITAAGGVGESLVENHRALNELCHALDPTRLTTMAHAFMLSPDDPLVFLPDVRAYNLYYGWYLGDLIQNDEFFDDFHQRYPKAAIGLSEYGADANPQYHSSHPEAGDYTEEYQCVFHEHLLKMWQERPWIWAMHVWNMFDFGADGRNEGGKPGQNQKGLVTFDRKTKKDAFYLYKAFLSKAPFVHLCGRRYVDRCEAVTEVKVYSNQSPVTLYVDGAPFGTQEGAHIFRFSVPITGRHTIEARAGNLSDSIVLHRVSVPNPAYQAPGTQVVNWFDKPEELVREGYYSILNTMAEVKQTPEGSALVAEIMVRARAGSGDVAQGITMPENIQRIMDETSLQKLLRKAGKSFGPADVKEINHTLNQIPLANRYGA